MYRVVLPAVTEQQVDRGWPEQDRQDERRNERAAGSNGKVTKYVENQGLVRNLSQPIQHRVTLAPQRGGGDAHVTRRHADRTARPCMKERLAAMGFDPVAGTSAEYGKLV